MSHSLHSSTIYAQACFHSCAHASAQLLSSALACFHLRAPCFHHAFSLHLYPASIKPDSTMTSLLIDSNRVNRYALYPPTKPQNRHNIDHSKAKWCWFSTRACFRLARVCVQLWALAYISPSPGIRTCPKVLANQTLKVHVAAAHWLSGERFLWNNPTKRISTVHH